MCTCISVYTGDGVNCVGKFISAFLLIGTFDQPIKIYILQGRYALTGTVEPGGFGAYPQSTCREYSFSAADIQEFLNFLKKIDVWTGPNNLFFFV